MFKAISQVSLVCAMFASLLIISTSGLEAQIAPGVTQSAARTANISGTVTRSNGSTVAGADVHLTGPAMLSTTTDTHGLFIFTNVPWGTYSVIVHSPLGTATRTNIVVAGDINVAVEYVGNNTANGLKEIAQVSTQSAGASINVTPASIASIAPSAYAFEGNTSWRELLNAIPGVSVSGALASGLSLGVPVPDGALYPIVLSINGSLPYETSTTLDGMPIINGSINSNAGCGTDLSYLPLSVFETADVVRGPGANAPSILNSIGGSFVLHAPSRVTKDHFELSVSNDPYGGTVANMKAEARFGRLSAVFVYGVNDSPGPLGTRAVTSLTTPGILAINGNAFAGCGTSGCTNYLGSSVYQNCSLCLVQNTIMLRGVPVSTAWTQHNGALALSYDFTPSITAQIFYVGSSSHSYRLPFLGLMDFAPGSGYSGSIAPGIQEAYYSGGTENAYAPIKQSASLLEEKITAYLGHGVVRLGALQNNSWIGQSWPTLPTGEYDLYGTGYYSSAPGTAVNFNGPAMVQFQPFSDLLNEDVQNRDLLGSYDLQIGQRSHVGVSYVSSYYDAPYTYDEYVGILFSGGPSSAISETTDEYRFNAGTDLSDALSLDASWYVARGTYHVQDPNNPTSWIDPAFPYSAPRLGVTWRTSRQVVIRGAAGGGFALPPLPYLVGVNGPPTCNVAYCEQTLTNVNLKPEESFGFDLGTDIRVHDNTVLSFDVYRTTLFGQVFQTVTENGTYNGEPLCVTQYNNLPSSRYEGINLEIQHDPARGLYWHGAFGLTRGYVVGVPSSFYNTAGNVCDVSTGANCQNTYIVAGINYDGKFQATVPYATATAQFGYRWSDHKYVDLQPTYYGNNNAYFEPAFVEFDAHASYPLTKSVSVIANFRNITNIYGQTLEFYQPTLGAPTVAWLPYALPGLPFGPRSVVVTINFAQ